MTATAVPGQAGDERGPVRGRPPVQPTVSEATRLLCAGVHLDGRFRSAVVDELYVHEERFTAPSFGFDAGRVLAHALYARRVELGWALGLLALWGLGALLSGGLFLLLLAPCLLLAVAPRIRGRGSNPSLFRRALAFYVRWQGRLGLAFGVFALLSAGLAPLFDDEETSGFYDDGELGYGESGWGTASEPGLSLSEDTVAPVLAWLTLAAFGCLVWCVARRRSGFARLMTGPLSPTAFPHAVSDPAELVSNPRGQRLKTLVRHEQQAPLVMYRAANPFRGAGHAVHNWTLGVELRPRKDRKPELIDNRTVLERIRPLVEGLRIPSGEVPDDVRDRLRELQIDECVFLPAEGIPSRHGAPYDTAAFEEHRRAAVEEGGETRRHFLRIRVGGWEEEVVVTVFVRVHTQGGMLMLEFAPHVLTPVARRFHEADRLAHRYLNNHLFGKIIWALAHTPRSLGESLVTVVRHLAGGWEMATGGHRGALPEGPALSVRERGSDPDWSLFQEMDVVRYLKSIEDRVADGVKRALYEAGWQTAEFEQKVVHVSGGVYIDSANNSAFGFGSHSTATTRNKTTTGGRRGKD